MATQRGGSQWAAIAAGRVEELRKSKAAAAAATRALKELEAAIAKIKADARDLAGKDRFGDALKAIAAFAGKHKEPEAGDAADKLKSEIGQRAQQRYDELAAAADAAVATKDYARARGALKPVGESFGVADLADQAKAKLAEIDATEKNAEHPARWDAIKAQAAKLTEEGKFDDALTLLETARAIPLDDLADRIADQVATVEDAHQAQLDAALTAYRPESDEVWAAFKARDYARADRLLADLAKKPEFQLAADALAADQQAARLLKDFWVAVEEGLQFKVGQFVAFGGEGGTITAVKDGQVTLTTPKGKATLPIHKLGARQALMYALLEDDARSHLFRGVYLLAEQTELDTAAQALAAAGDAPHLAACRDRLDALRLGAAELAARKAWRKIQRYAQSRLTQSRASCLLAMLDAFEAEHKETRHAQAAREGLAELRDRANTVGEGWEKLLGGSSLTGWRVVGEGEFARHGAVRVQHGQVTLEARRFTGIAWTQEFPGSNYEFSFDAMRIDGTRTFFGVVFPVGDAHCTLSGGTWGGVGLDRVDGVSGDQNMTARRVPFENGRWYRVRLRVTDAGISVWLDGERVIDIPRTGHRFELWSGVVPLRPLGLYACQARAALRHIQFRRLR